MEREAVELSYVKDFCQWLDTNWRRGKGKKGHGWFHVGDFYKQSKPIRTKDLAEKWYTTRQQNPQNTISP